MFLIEFETHVPLQVDNDKMCLTNAAHRQTDDQTDRWSFGKQKQGRIHGNTVADGWAGAVMRKLFGIQKCDRQTDLPTYRPTDRHGKV